MTKHRKTAYFLLVMVSLIWGFATPVVKLTLAGIEPLPFLTYRFAISAVLGVLLIFPVRDRLRVIFKNLGLVLFYSFLTTTFALGLIFFGIKNTTIIDTAVITAVGPLLTTAAGYYLLKERVTKRERFGTALAFIGVLVTIVGPLLSSESIRFSGNILVLGYILVMAYSSVLTKKLMRKGVDPFVLSHVSFVVGFLTILPFTLGQSSYMALVDTVVSLPFNYHLGVIYMALISGTLAYALWSKAQKSIEVSEAGLFAYLIPVFAAPFGIFLGEKMTFSFILGGIFILVGVIYAEAKR